MFKKSLWLLLPVFALLLVSAGHKEWSSAPLVHASVNCDLPSGSSVATIQAAITAGAAANCTVAGNVPNSHTVFLQAGSYTTTSGITVPCPSTSAGLVVTGPPAAYRPPSNTLPGTYAYSTPYTANLNGSVANNFSWVVGSNGCTNQITFQYLNFNAGQPSGGGGNWLEIVGGENNVTVTHNFIHGQWANVSASHDYDDAIALESGGTTQTPINSGITITYNVFGDGNTDCNAVMNLVTYQGGKFDSTGGYCGALGVHSSTTNLVVQFNDFEHLEQPMKFFESAGGSGDFTHTYLLNNGLIDSNDVGQWHRIGLEGQQAVAASTSQGSQFNITNNSFHDPIDPQYGSYGFSVPQCCENFHGFTGTGATDNRTNCNNNTMLDNVPSPTFTGYAFEWWSTGNCDHNLMTGHWNENNGSPSSSSAGAIGWGDTSNTTRLWSASFNTAQFQITNGQAVTREVEHTNIPPTQTGNVTTYSYVRSTSASPTISPSGGALTFPTTITLTDAGITNTSTPLPQGNTGIWYTTNGSDPVPGSGTALRLDNGGTFVLSGPATVKAVGMWGAVNQPAIYPANFGWNPSLPVSATFTGSGTISLASAFLTAPGGANTVGVGGTLQMHATCVYSDSSQLPCDTTDAHGNSVLQWQTSAAGVANIGLVGSGSPGLVTGVSAGPPSTTNITALVGPTGGASTVTSNIYTITVTTVTLSSISLATTGGVSSLTVGGTNQLIATCHYSDGSTTSCGAIDSHGTTISTWTISDPTKATINPAGGATPGLITAVAPGSVTLGASAGNTTANLGVSNENQAGLNHSGALNSQYMVTGPSGAGYSVNSCTFFLAAGTQTSGAHWDCGLVAAPTPTSQSTSYLCHATYTTSGTTSPNAFVTIPLTGCGTLPANSAYWLAMSTDQSSAPEGFYDCGGAGCTGSAPSTGVGTYPCAYTGVTYGTYVGMNPTMNLGCGSAGWQSSQYVSLSTTATVTAPTIPLTINSAAVTLTGVTIAMTGGAVSIPIGGSLQIVATCFYSDFTNDVCTSTDPHGNVAGNYLSSNTTIASVTNAGGLIQGLAAGTASFTATAGAFTSPGVPLNIAAPTPTIQNTILFGPITLKGAVIVNPPPHFFLGNGQQNASATVANNLLVETYAVSGNAPRGFTVNRCTFFLATGTQISGKHWDCGIILAPTATTQATSWLCHATYTTSGTSEPGTWVSIALTGCGTLAPSTPYWVVTNTDDTTPAHLGFWDCATGCAGSAPTGGGTGTYPYYKVANTYGTYTGLTTSLTVGGTLQASQFVDLSAAP